MRIQFEENRFLLKSKTVLISGDSSETPSFEVKIVPFKAAYRILNVYCYFECSYCCYFHSLAILLMFFWPNGLAADRSLDTPPEIDHFVSGLGPRIN